MDQQEKKKPLRELTGPLKNEDLTGSVDGNAGRQQLRAEIRQQSQNERKISTRRWNASGQVFVAGRGVHQQTAVGHEMGMASGVIVQHSQNSLQTASGF